ncbi:unnamed protein product [Rhizoctonia solani]|uniref:F-box domain-containing protein n=1 Tax=Rhizoctonia solani TaxID=456999 RepID=A0A8H2XKL7_9AGAM|nr:unnamed protein product [Rhizoctonia solani]
MEQQTEADTSFEPNKTTNPASPTASVFSSKDNLSPSPPPENDSIPQLIPLPPSPTPSQIELPGTLNLYRLPEEILIYVFFLLINHASPGSPRERPLDWTVRSSYKQLFIIISVCSDWRRICLSRGAFWSLISACKHWNEPESVMNLCLERARGSDIHLDGGLGHVSDPKLLEVIANYGPRIRTLNIAGDNPEVLRNTVTSLQVHSKPGCTNSLFIYNRQVTLDGEGHHTWPYLFPSTDPEHSLFNGYTDAMSSLRLRGFRLHWGQTSFSRLVELKIQSICPETLAEVGDLMHAIASAPQLRRLQLVDVRCHLDAIHTLQIDRPGDAPVFHPNLEFLFLKNIRWGLLLLILRSIIPGSYKTTISYSRREYLRRYSTDLTVLKESGLQGFNIDTLLVSRNWVHRSEFLPSLLKAMPSIKTLSLAHCEFSKETFQVLTRPQKSDVDEGETEFPTIRRLHMLGSTFDPQELDGLKEVVTSHGIQELKLGGSIDELKSDSEHTPTLERPVRFEDPKDDEQTAPMKDWLRDTVPDFGIVRRLEDFPDFDFQSYDW